MLRKHTLSRTVSYLNVEQNFKYSPLHLQDMMTVTHPSIVSPPALLDGKPLMLHDTSVHFSS